MHSALRRYEGLDWERTDEFADTSSETTTGVLQSWPMGP